MDYRSGNYIEDLKNKAEYLDEKNKKLKEELAQVKANHRLLFITLLIVTIINSIGIVLRIVQ